MGRCDVTSELYFFDVGIAKDYNLRVNLVRVLQVCWEIEGGIRRGYICVVFAW